MPEINIFDRVLKIIGRNYGKAFLNIAFPDMSVDLIGTEENVEISLPERPVDFVYRIRYNQKEYIFHIEFQLRHESDFPQRMFIYSAELTAQFKMPVLSLALYLEHRTSPIPNEYLVTLDSVEVNRFNYIVLKLWDYKDDILSGQLFELAPLLTLISEKPDEELLTKEKELILREADAQKRSELLASAVTIASRYFDKEFLWRFFREEVEQMRNASFIEDWIEEASKKAAKEAARKAANKARKEALIKGKEEGLQQGLQQGLKQGLKKEGRKNLLRIIDKRFGRFPYDLPIRLEELSVEQIEELIDIALEVDSLDTFEEQFDLLQKSAE